MNELLEFLKSIGDCSDPSSWILSITYDRCFDSYIFKLSHYNVKMSNRYSTVQAISDVEWQRVLVDSKLTTILNKLYEAVKEKEAEDERESRETG